MCTDELYNCFIFKNNFKETSPCEKHKTSFGVQTTIVLNLQVELTKPANDGLRTFNSIDFFTSHKLQATSFKLRAASFKLQATSYKLQVMSQEIQDMSYELRVRRYKIVPAPADDSMVQPCPLV